MELGIEHEKLPIVSILSKVKKIGRYMDADIWEYIELEDGRFFQWESVAIEIVPGSKVYYTDHPDDTYILVQPNLLYREIKRQ